MEVLINQKIVFFISVLLHAMSAKPQGAQERSELSTETGRAKHWQANKVVTEGVDLA